MDRLKVVGVDSKGYGKVYKLVMRNPGITLCSKALYAYLCSYAGNGKTAFPKREKIMKDLGLAKNTFTKHLGMLVEAKYIARTKTPAGNVYEILTRVPDKDGNIIDIKTKGYGTIPKYAMLDRRLSAAAKAVYAYFCSYAGAGNTAYPHRNTILKELDLGTTAYYKHYNSLIECGYVTPAQSTSERGRFGATTYKLNEILGIDPSKDPDEITASSQKAIHGQKPHSDGENSVLSQKAIHGGNEGVSQNPIHGDFCDSYKDISSMSQKEIHGDNVENFLPQKPLSQIVASRQPVSRELSHPYTNNTLIINNSFSDEKEKISNIPAVACDCIESFPCYTKKMINEAIDYQKLITEAVAWANLKSMLNHFESDADKKLYCKKHREIISEFAKQLHYFLSRKEPVMVVDNKAYPYAELRERLLKRMNFEDALELCSNVADKYREIRSVRQYVRRVVFNLAIQEYGDV